MGKQKQTSADINHRPNINYSPKTQQQAELYHQLERNDIMVVLGPAGTCKTYTCCVKAAQWLVQGKIKKIVLARANVATGKSLGAVPGDMAEKLQPWTMPMTDVLSSALGKGFYDYCVSRQRIETQALETIRGRSFDDAFILVDECQQLTLDEIKAIVTRVGEGSVLCLMGDPKQTDLASRSGIGMFIDLINKHDPEYVNLVEFGLDDIVRSNACAQMVKMFYKAGL